MSIELQITVLGVILAVVIGAWQIYLARKQVQSAQETARKAESISMAAEPPVDSHQIRDQRSLGH